MKKISLLSKERQSLILFTLLKKTATKLSDVVRYFTHNWWFSPVEIIENDGGFTILYSENVALPKKLYIISSSNTGRQQKLLENSDLKYFLTEKGWFITTNLLGNVETFKCNKCEALDTLKVTEKDFQEAAEFADKGQFRFDLSDILTIKSTATRLKEYHELAY